MVLRTTLLSGIRGIAKIHKRQQKLRRTPKRRWLQLEALETRLLLTGEPFHPIPNDDPVIDPTPESRVDRHEYFGRIALANHDPNELAANHALLDANRDPRVPSFQSLRFELGELRWNMYSGYPTHYVEIPPTPGGYHSAPRSVPDPRDGDDPLGFFNFQGPSADDYAAASHFLDVRADEFEQYLPEVASWTFGDNLHLFVPDDLTSGTTTDTEVHVFTTHPDPDTTVSYDLNSTIVITTTVGSSGAWSYQETLTVAYDVVTTFDTAAIDWTLHQWGTYSYVFTAAGDDTADTYSVDTTAVDDFVDTYLETMSGGDGVSVINQGTYAYVADASQTRNDHLAGVVTQNPDGSYTTAYTESGDYVQDADFSATGTTDYFRTVGNLWNDDGRTSTEHSAIDETHHQEIDSVYTGSGSIDVDPAGAKSKTGLRDHDGQGVGSYSFTNAGAFAYQDAVPEGPDRLSRVLRHETWNEDLDDVFDYAYEDDIVFNADGTQVIHSQETGDASGDYTTSGDHMLQWFLKEGDYLAGDGLIEQYFEHSIDRPHLSPLVDTSSYWYAYDDDLVRTLNAAGQQTGITGTSSRDGGAATSWQVHVDGSYTVNEKDIAFDYTSSSTQSDIWTENMVDAYALDYTDVITYASDGSGALDHDVLETGSGGGGWGFSINGDYDWDATAADGKWQDSYDADYLRAYWEGAGYTYNNDTLTKKNAAGNEIHRTGTISTTSSGGGTRGIDASNAYQYSYSSGDGVTKTVSYGWSEDVADYFSYLNQNIATYLGDVPRVDYSVVETGSGSGNRTDNWTSDVTYTASYSSSGNSSNYHISTHYTSLDKEDYGYNYQENFLTNVWSDGTVQVNGTITDSGTSSGTVDVHDWGTETSSSSSPSGSSWSSYVWDLKSLDVYSHSYAYVRWVFLAPNNWGPTTSITGSETTSRSGSHTYTETYSWSYSYDGYSNSDSSTYTDNGSYNYSDTMTDEQFEGPRAGRSRIYGWGLSLLRFLRHGRFHEG